MVSNIIIASVVKSHISIKKNNSNGLNLNFSLSCYSFLSTNNRHASPKLRFTTMLCAKPRVTSSPFYGVISPAFPLLLRQMQAIKQNTLWAKFDLGPVKKTITFPTGGCVCLFSLVFFLFFVMFLFAESNFKRLW